MIKKLLLTLLLLFTNWVINSQEISGIVYGSKTKLPLANIAVLTNLNVGTSTDFEGKFTLDTSNATTINFTSLGFKGKKLLLTELAQMNNIVYLQEEINSLEEISITFSKISLDSLIIRTKDSMKKHFINRFRKQQFYVRDAQILDFEKLELDLKKSTLLTRKKRKIARKELEKTSRELLENKPKIVTEYLTFSSPIQIIRDSTKTDPKKKFRIYDNIDSVQGFTKSDIGGGMKIDKIEEKLSKIILKYLDTTKTYKTKSGFFKLEDSLSFKEVIKETDSLQENQSFYPRSGTYTKNSAYYKAVFLKKQKQRNFLNRNYYDHKLLPNRMVGNEMMYVIVFSPRKSKAKLTGEIFINSKDYCVKKITYKFPENKRGQHLNLKFLFGVKFSEEVKEGVIFYEKNEQGKVYPSYYKESSRNYGYIDRPIKFTENSSESEKIKFNVMVSLNIIDTREYFSSYAIEINKDKIGEAIKRKTFFSEKYNPMKKYMSLEAYNTENWTDRKLIKAYLERFNN